MIRQGSLQSFQNTDIMQCDWPYVYSNQQIPYLIPEFQQSYYQDELQQQNTRQINIDLKDRTFIIDYMCHYHTKFNFANITFENAIYLFDTITKNNLVRRCDLRMIATACLLIAAKNEQTYIVSMKNFIDGLKKQNNIYRDFDAHYVACEMCLHRGEKGDDCIKPIRIDETQVSLSTDSYKASVNQYYYTQVQEPTCCQDCLRQVLCKTEILCLQLLDFKVSYVVPMNFLRRFIQLLKLSDKQKYITFYLAELLMLDGEYSQKLLPSEIAVAALAMEQKLLRSNIWPQEMQQFSFFGRNTQTQNIQQKVVDLAHIMNGSMKRLALSNRIQYFRRRYAQYYRVSTSIEELLKQFLQ